MDNDYVKRRLTLLYIVIVHRRRAIVGERTGGVGRRRAMHPPGSSAKFKYKPILPAHRPPVYYRVSNYTACADIDLRSAPGPRV